MGMTIPRLIALVLLLIIFTATFYIFWDEVRTLVRVIITLAAIIIGSFVVSYLIMVAVTGHWIALGNWW